MAELPHFHLNIVNFIAYETFQIWTSRHKLCTTIIYLQLRYVGTVPRMDLPTKTPTLVASTGDTFNCSIAESRARERALQNAQSDPASILHIAEDEQESNYFKGAQWYMSHPSLDLTNNSQDPRWNHPPNLQRRQHNPHVHPPTRPPILAFSNHPKIVYDPHFPHFSKYRRTLPTLLSPRPQHNPLPLHPNLPPDPSPKLSFPLSNTIVHLQPNKSNDGSIPHALLSPLVFPGNPLFNRHRLSDRTL